MFRAFPRVAAAGATAAVATASSPAAAEALHSVPFHRGGWDQQRSRFIRDPEDAEEWDLCSVEEMSRSQVISVGPVPTKAEAVAAAQELLQASPRAFSDHADVEEIHSASAPAGIAVAAASEGHPSPLQREGSGIHLSEGPMQHVQLARSQGSLATRVAGSHGTDIVTRAFRAFERDPDVQDAVTALVQDPKIWEAINQNPSVRAILLRRAIPSIAGAGPMEEGGAPMAAAGNTNPPPTAHTDPLGDFMRVIAAQLKSVVTRMDGFFLWLKKAVFGNGPSGTQSVDSVDIVGIIVVVIAVIAVVIFRRPVGSMA